MKLLLIYSALIFVFSACNSKGVIQKDNPNVFVVVLGIAQDAGYPQAGCTKSCCLPVWNGSVDKEKVVSVGLVDIPNNKVWLFDATPDFKDQLHNLLSFLPNPDIGSLGGIFITHAHIGHYTGLMQLGHEAMGANRIPVFVMPKMKSFLEENGPWSQLVNYKNIKLIPLQNDSSIALTDAIRLLPLKVPHRDEYSETVGFKVSVRNNSFLFIPDIDKWSKWERDIFKEVDMVNYAFLDGSFYSDNELPNRDMRQIPHPFVPETMAVFDQSADSTKKKVVFIHFNHTNPLIHNTEASRSVLQQGYNVAREGDIFKLD